MSEFSEDQMLECLEKNPPDIASLVGPLTVLHEEDPETAEAHAKLIRITLAEKAAYSQLIDLFKVLADWNGADREWRQSAQRDLAKAFEADPLQSMYLELSGIDSPRVRVKEALRRIGLLTELAPGRYVYMKSFGFGIVKEVRHGERRVVVDFAKKPGHDLQMGFAAETMELVDETHLYARRHLQAEDLQALVSENPAEVVRIALRSFGPTPAAQLQDLLVPHILPDSAWKNFWAAARKGLKNDPKVVIPAKRMEPIELLDEEKSYDQKWFRELSAQRNMASILSQVEEYLDVCGGQNLDATARVVLVERLRFVVIGGQGKHHDFLVRAWLIARKLQITDGEVNLTGFLSRVMGTEGMLGVVQTLSAALTKQFFAALAETDPVAAADVLVKVLPDLEYSALNEAIEQMFSLEHESRVASALRPGWNQWTAEVDVMYWLSQHPEKISTWNFGSTPDLVARLLKVINRDYAGSRLRVQNQLRETFRQPAWLNKVLGAMDERQRRAFTQGVKDSTAWEQLDKASVLGQIVKIDPSLQDIITGRSDEDGPMLAPRMKVTSVRSFRERQALLKKITEKDIPENTKEIAVARSYGDLRENFEYKAAKDTQRLLNARRLEVETQLREVKPTDFSEFTLDAIGIATSVRLRHADGHESVFHILGEWDSDVTRHIIPVGSGLAKSLQGGRPGDVMTVPSENGPEQITVVSVEALTPDVLAWLAEGSGGEG